MEAAKYQANLLAQAEQEALKAKSKENAAWELLKAARAKMNLAMVKARSILFESW